LKININLKMKDKKLKNNGLQELLKPDNSDREQRKLEQASAIIQKQEQKELRKKLLREKRKKRENDNESSKDDSKRYSTYDLISSEKPPSRKYTEENIVDPELEFKNNFGK
jgi:hypothetical protein